MRQNVPGAFTLIELLVVISIIMVLVGLVVLPMTHMRSAGDLTKTTSDIEGILAEARAYAMANHTYVWVGFTETDAAKDASVTPQTSGTGRVTVAVVASKDGTRDYSTKDPNLSPPPFLYNGSRTNTGATLTAIYPLKHFENVHMALSGVLNGNSTGTVGTGGMQRPGINDSDYIIANQSTPVSVTNFAWPLGRSYPDPSAQYNFATVINFDPRGVARIQTAGNKNAIGQYFEIGLQQAHGNIVASADPNIAAIQIDCMSGATHVYRP